MNAALPLLLLALPAGAELPLVKLVAAGGTVTNSPAGRLAPAEALARVPGVSAHARVEAEEFNRGPSVEVTMEQWLALARRVEALLAERGVAGVVVTHGSNTLEETAYFLSLVAPGDKPLVLTAAQRPLDTPGSDAPLNILQAVRVAAHPAARGRGALVVAGERVHAARDVTKTLGRRPEAWSSGDLGALGWADEDRVVFRRAPARGRAPRFSVRELARLPRVDVLFCHAGADGALVEAALAAKAEGLVLASFPGGACAPGAEAAALAAAARGVPVVLAHRGGRGRVWRDGGKPWALWAEDLTPQKARVLLMLGLTRTREPAALQALFDEL